MHNSHSVSADSVALYFNPRRKVFFVAQERRRGRGKAETGELLEIVDSDFDSRVCAVVVSCLDKFQANAYSQEEVGHRSPVKTREFIRQHLGVNVERTPTGDFIIQPLHHNEGGYTGREEEQIVLGKNEVPGRLSSTLRSAFQIAT